MINTIQSIAYFIRWLNVTYTVKPEIETVIDKGVVRIQWPIGNWYYVVYFNSNGVHRSHRYMHLQDVCEEIDFTSGESLTPLMEWIGNKEHHEY